jgi:hypothetical protein
MDLIAKKGIKIYAIQIALPDILLPAGDSRTPSPLKQSFGSL